MAIESNDRLVASMWAKLKSAGVNRGDHEKATEALKKCVGRVHLLKCYKNETGYITIKIGVEDHVGKEGAYCSWFKCPKCQKDWLREGFNYCPKCGVRIEFDKFD